MKKQWMFSLAALLLSATAFGQVESDDMYFNSKDRATLKAQKASEQSSYVVASAKKPKKVEQAAAEEVINPTDSYSARNVNPEFAARSNSQTAAADNQDYFMSNYKYTTASNLNTWNSNYNNYAGSPWYAPNYYGPSINEWGSPYGSRYYNPWCSPYYSSGYSSSFSYYGGSSWNYGWGMGMGMGMSYAYGNPYMNSWGGYPGYGYGYYPSTVVIVNNGGDNGRKVVYGKRASHGGMVTTPQDASYTRSRTNNAPAVRPTATDAGGRVSTSGRTTQRQEDYYNRSWRGSQQTNSTQQNRSSYDPWSNSNRSGTDSYNRDSNSSYSPSRSSGSDGGGTRQAAPASSGSGGRTRGRD